MDLKQKTLLFIRQHQLIQAGSTIVLGVSGGVDSVVLAHVLNSLRHELSIHLHIMHYNHHLRASSNRDQKFVEQLTLQMNIPLIVGENQSKSKKHVSEDAARTLRFKFFIKTAQKLKVDSIVLAHNQNDVAETVMMRLIRGSGLYGLRSIMPQRIIDGVNCVRPLLDVKRQEIENYAHRWRIKYCTDETNTKPIYLRNKVRLNLLPHIADEYNPSIYDVLADLAITTQDDYDFLNQILIQRIKKLLVTGRQTVKIRFDLLLKEHPSMRRLLMRHCYQLVSGDLNQLTYAHINQVEHLITHRPEDSVVDWPKSVRVKKLKRFLEFTV